MKKINKKQEEVEVISPEAEKEIKINLGVETHLSHMNKMDISNNKGTVEMLHSKRVRFLNIYKYALIGWIAVTILSILNIASKVTDTDYMTMAYNQYLLVTNEPLFFDEYRSLATSGVWQQLAIGVIAGLVIHGMTYRSVTKTTSRMAMVMTIAVCAFGLMAKMNQSSIDTFTSLVTVGAIFADLAIAISLMIVYTTMSKINTFMAMNNQLNKNIVN